MSDEEACRAALLEAWNDQVPGSWFVWLDLAGYHARYGWEPKGAKPRVSADTLAELIAKIPAAPQG